MCGRVSNKLGWNSNNSKLTTVQLFEGIVWYHYFGVTGKSAFVTAGIGRYHFEIANLKEHGNGGAFQIGGGYEFSKHVQIGGYLAIGETKYQGIKYDHHHFGVIITGLAY